MSYEMIEAGELMPRKDGSVDPSLFPDETFELYSIPAFDRGTPDVVKGSDIGSAKPLVKPNDVLISRIVPHIRRAGIVGPNKGIRQIASSEWIVFRDARIHPEYLRQYLVSDKFNTAFMSTVAGVGGSLMRARPSAVSRIFIPLPPLEEQRRIAEVLDKADALRQKRRLALQKLDTLLQSIFLEMFGDPRTNPKGLPKESLGELIRVKSGEFLPGKSFAIGGLVPVFGGNGINGYHDEALFKEPTIVIGRVGVYCGSVHLTTGSSWITDNALYVSECSARLRQTYLYHALKYADLNQYAGRFAQPLISGSRIYPVPLLIPPIETQERFNGAVIETNRLLRKGEESLSRFDNLYMSVQNRAFNGQL